MKKIVSTFFLLIGLLGFAQIYPVQLTPIFNSPYSSKLADYTNTFEPKFQLLVNTTDFAITNRQVRLKLIVEGNGIKAESSDFVIAPSPIYINGGELMTLTNSDLGYLFKLENLQGINPLQYSSFLPEGMYSFCFEMYDMMTNQRISLSSCAYLYLMLNDPPFLNLPAKKEQIMATDFPNIFFSWTPRNGNVTNVSYHFEIKEIFDPTIDPEYGFLMSPLLYEETLYTTAFVYDLGKPALLPGKRYAWRVKAISTGGLSENAVFKNDGYSEIYWFTYATNCSAPAFVLAQLQGSKSVKITWQGNNVMHNKYHLQYRKSNVADAEWFSTYTQNEQATINDLEANQDYEYRVGASCEPPTTASSYTYSGINHFETPAQGQKTDFSCGLNPAITISNQTPIKNLLTGETFTAGDFPIKILEISGTENFSGKGYVTVPYLNDTKIAVAFENIKINTNYQLIDGVVETTYNPDWKNIADVEDLTATGDNGEVLTKEVPYQIVNITTDANGDIKVNGSNGEQIIIPGGSALTITDSSGKVYTVDSQGEASGPYVAAAGGATTPSNTAGVAAGKGNQPAQVTAITATGIKVTFEPTKNTLYAFDKCPKDAPDNIKNQYKKVGNDYLVYKAVPKGKTDYIFAKVAISDSNINKDNIVFKTITGIEIEKEPLDDGFLLTLKGIHNYVEEEVIATLKQDGKDQIAGAFKLVHLSEKTINLTLVPLNRSSSIPADAAVNLQAIYAKAGVKLNIKIAPVLPYDGGADKAITTSESGIFDYYTDEEKAINTQIKALATYDKDSYYLIYSNLPSTKGIDGFMALGGQFGYVFPNASGKTAAHELGHGIFILEHPFASESDKAKTPFLLDYGNGTELWHQDWAQINNPKLKFYGFQKDSEGEYETDGHYSTVYLVSLMLGMEPSKAKQLAEATEAPDTDVHSETNFEIDDTWSDGEYQETIHSLTGGFHGSEEFLTAIQFIYTPNQNISKLGELLHRFGDTYAHTKLDNLGTENLGEYKLYENPENEKAAIKSWKGKGGIRLNDKVEPWILFFNYYLKKYGMGFFTSYTKQREVFNGRTLKETLNDIYLVSDTDKYIMYGGEKNILGLTEDHALSDGSFPDKIYLRPNWYLDYVKNLAWLLSKKYNLNTSGFDIKLFEKMTNFAVANKCSLKGIIDYEIAKKFKKTKFYVPVFYSNPNRFFASYDAIENTDYYQTAIDVVDKTKLYISKDGIFKSIIVNPIKDMHVKYNSKTGFFRTTAFQINLKK